MTKPYTRKVTYTERMFLAVDEYSPPAANQIFFEGSGVFDLKKWKAAVEKASAANPGTRLRLKGHLGRSRWVDSGITPPVIEVDGSAWSGNGPEGAPFLDKRLHPRDSHTCEVLLIHGPIPKIGFRTHHAVTDAAGTFNWMEDIFRILNGLEPIGTSSTLTDLELMRSFQKKYRTPFPHDNLAPTGKPQGNESGLTWKRIDLTGRYKNFLGQVAILAAKEAWKHSQGPVRFGVPVDLRHRFKGLRSTCNLSISIYIEVKPDSTPEEIAKDVKHQIELGHDGMVDRFDPLIRFVPESLMIRSYKKSIKEKHGKGLYSSSGVLSNVGLVPAALFCGGGFTSNIGWAVPPSVEILPVMCAMGSSKDNHAVIIATMPKVLASNGRLDQFMDTIAKGLVIAPDKK